MFFLTICLALTAAVASAQTRLGFTSWPYAPTSGAVDRTYRFIRAEGDIVAEQLDDKVPWRAFLNDTDPPKSARREIANRRTRLGGMRTRLVSVTPFNTGRDGLAPGYSGRSPKLSELSDPALAEVFARYCLWVIAELEPDYFLLGIEVNEFRANRPEAWRAYAGFAKRVRSRIRDRHPKLPISESVSLHNLLGGDSAGRKSVQADLLAHVNGLDFTAVSYYPFMTGAFDKRSFERALTWVGRWSPNPIAITETGFPAERLVLRSWNVDVPFTPADQARYMEALLAQARRDRYRFVIWWTHRDYDALMKSFPRSVRELGRIWRDTGLLDEDGHARPALDLWRAAR